jgi:hypothetical protein
LRTSGEPIAESPAVAPPPPPPLVAFELKFAVTAWAVVSFTVHVAFAPEQAPLQPRNDCPADGLAASVTEAPALKCWMQVLLGPTAVHAPAVVETVPLPPTLIVSVPGVPPVVKVAETLLALVIDTEHVGAVPAHEPPQPANFAPVAGFSVSVTVEPWATCALHAAEPLPQAIAPPVTLPGPVTDTVSWTLLVPPVNVAVTDFDALKVTVQVVAVPVHVPPPQPANVAPVEGVSVSVTVELAAWFALVQVVAPLPQLIPLPVTVPFPLTETVSVKVVVGGGVAPLNVAVTLLAWFIETEQVVAVPPQAPVQPKKVAPVAGDATSVTDALAAKFAEQMVAPSPQLIAPLPPLTFPFPTRLTVSVFAGANVAVTDLAASIVSVQLGLVPEQPDAPLQPVNTCPSSGSALSSTVLFSATFATQVPGQWIAPPETLPLPVMLTVSWTFEPAAGPQAAPT